MRMEKLPLAKFGGHNPLLIDDRDRPLFDQEVRASSGSLSSCGSQYG
jgi:hypothetical protein